MEVEESAKINAYIDGEKVVFYKGIIKLLDDEERAVVLWYEYTHAMLIHINKQKENMMIGLVMGCKPDQGSVAVGNMMDEQYGVEPYEFSCASGKIKVVREFSNCTEV